MNLRTVLRTLLLGPKLKSRKARIARNIFLALAVGFMALLIEPAPLFAHEVSHPRFKLHSDAQLAAESTRVVLDRAAARLATSGIDDPACTFRLYACNAGWRMRLLAPFSTGAFGMNNAANTIVLNRCDVDADRIFARTRERSLSGVIAHEATHTLLRRRFGRIATLRMPRWKEEGICDAVAGDSSFDLEEGKALIRAGRDDPSGSFFYLRARLMVELLREEGLTFDEIVARDLDEDAVLARLRARLSR